MKRKSMLLAIFVGVALISVLAIQYATQAQQPPQRPGGPAGERPAGMGRMPGMFVSQAAPLEDALAQLCLEIGIDDATMSKARKHFKEAWENRKKMIQKAEAASGDRQAMQTMRTDAEKIYTDLMAKLKDVVPADQMKKLNDWEKARQSQQQRRPQQQPSNR